MLVATFQNWECKVHLLFLCFCFGLNRSDQFSFGPKSVMPEHSFNCRRYARLSRDGGPGASTESCGRKIVWAAVRMRRLGMVWHCMQGHGMEGIGMERHGMRWHGTERHCMERHGMREHGSGQSIVVQIGPKHCRPNWAEILSSKSGRCICVQIGPINFRLILTDGK